MFLRDNADTYFRESKQIVNGSTTSTALRCFFVSYITYLRSEKQSAAYYKCKILAEKEKQFAADIFIASQYLLWWQTV